MVSIEDWTPALLCHGTDTLSLACLAGVIIGITITTSVVWICKIRVSYRPASNDNDSNMPEEDTVNPTQDQDIVMEAGSVKSPDSLSDQSSYYSMVDRWMTELTAIKQELTEGLQMHEILKNAIRDRCVAANIDLLDT